MNNNFPENEVCAIADQLVEALGYLHENGFAHRDLKPEVCQTLSITFHRLFCLPYFL